MASEQKLKEGDFISQHTETTNKSDLIFFSDKCSVYKAKLSQFADSKASAMGDYIPAKLSFDKEENVVYAVNTTDYKGYMIFVFENGKVAKVDISCYETKNNRKKLIKAFSDASELVSALYIKEDCEIVIKSSSGRYLLLNTGAIAPKTTKNTLGVRVMTLKKGHRVISAELYTENRFTKPSRYRTKSLPAAGATLSSEDEGEQMTL
jgi:DNA gyrase subunit A